MTWAAYMRRALAVVAVLLVGLAALVYVNRALIVEKSADSAYYQVGEVRDAAQWAELKLVGFDVAGAETGPELLSRLPGGLIHRPRSKPEPVFGHRTPSSLSPVVEILRRDECLLVKDVKLVRRGGANEPGLVIPAIGGDPSGVLCPANAAAACLGATVWIAGRRADC